MRTFGSLLHAVSAPHVLRRYLGVDARLVMRGPAAVSSPVMQAASPPRDPE
jgi:hypothetical protein